MADNHFSQLEAADGFVSSEVGLMPHTSKSTTPTLEHPPQSSSLSLNSPQSPMTEQTSQSSTQTYSFVFTSSRSSTNLRHQNVIGVVAAGGRTSTNNVLPNILPTPALSTSGITRSPAVLTPEQIRVHALGAQHAIPAHSPFVQLARNRSTSTVVTLPFQSSIFESDEDRSSHKRGIDFYMDAARVANTRPPHSQPATPIPQHVTSPPLSPDGHASPKQTPTMRSESRRLLPISHSVSDTNSTKKKHIRSKVRTGRGCPEGFSKTRYTNYQENDPDRPSFISCSLATRDTSSSSHSSSSGKSVTSLDESITGMSAFGILGSGNAEFVFGSAVVNKPPKQLASDI